MKTLATVLVSNMYGVIGLLAVRFATGDKDLAVASSVVIGLIVCAVVTESRRDES